ncbi:short-chain fatty acid transporter [Aquisalibacillus elongatus]|uniref:Short-chain fatty acids transporter n=1 Tax=Aquisalibacillus elongatus TaxID=485577 RepID=A0A3N5C437_9BACI|nr:TIGR00366 family protein [Aquisalibacillus elongatus]RPF54222.1 short-chain fatty acids transporter [Aquisalibacillus elongatus]
MLRSISQKFKVGIENYLPSAFIFAILLTFITLILGMTVTGENLFDMTTYWYGGFWDFLAFTTQMILILITGYALVKAPLVHNLLIKLASKPKTQKSAIITVILAAAATGYLSWGLGFVFGTLFAIEVAKRVQEADFRILIAAAYTGTIAILPASISLTAPLLVNTPDHSLQDEIGLIPLSQTTFSPMMLLTAFIGLAVVLFAYIKMAPKKEDVVPYQHNKEDEESLEEISATTTHTTFADKLNNSRIINYALVLLGFLWLILYMINNGGFNLELNIMNFTFIMLGLALHGTPASYMNAITDGMPSASGILLQFPFYAGIMGMMIGSGLITVIAESFASIANGVTFPFFSFLSAAIVNVFVPSAGGQWQIQGPILVEALQTFNLPAEVVVNTVSIGDVTTNLLQPFFVLPALGLAKLGLKDIWGYCLVSMILLFIVTSIIVTVLPIFLY